MMKTNDITSKTIFDQIQITNLGSKDENARNDNAKQSGKF